MHFAIAFTNLSYADFAALKEETVFTAIKLSPLTVAFGENIYGGNTSLNEKCFLFEYHTDQIPVASFFISSDGKTVFYHYTDNTSPQSVLSLIRGNITKFCLQEQGYFCLHAAAMCIEDKVVLLIGKKGAGKSTLSAYFHSKGHEIWCDDYAMLHQENGNFFVSQGETSLKVNPDIATALSIHPDNLQRVFELPPDWISTADSDIITQKSYYQRQAAATDLVPRQAAAVFFIHPRVPAPEEITTVSNKTGALGLLMEEVLLPGINSRQYLQLYFQSSLTFLENVPAFNIYPPDNIQRIEEVYDAILETLNIVSYGSGIR